MRGPARSTCRELRPPRPHRRHRWARGWSRSIRPARHLVQPRGGAHHGRARARMRSARAWRRSSETARRSGRVSRARLATERARAALRVPPPPARRPARCRLGISCLVAALPVAATWPGSSVIFQDLTEVVQMEQRAAPGERLAAVGQLAANMAHEIRNPLASISGSIELLARDLPAATRPGASSSRSCCARSARLNRLVGDFLEYARPAPRRRSRSPWPSSSTRCCSQMRDARCPPPEGVARVRRVAAALGPTRSQLRQVLWNLLPQRGPGDARRR